MKLVHAMILGITLTFPLGGRAATLAYPINVNNVTAELVATGTEAWGRVEQSNSILLPNGSYWEKQPYILPNTDFGISPDGGLDPCRNACSPFYGGVFGSPPSMEAIEDLDSNVGAPNWQSTEFFTVFDPHDSAPTSQAVLQFRQPQKSLSLLWGSPDLGNTVTFLLSDLVIGSFSGSEFNLFTDVPGIIGNPGTGVAMLKLTSLPFDSVVFSANARTGSFEFSNLTSMPSVVPLPSPLFLLVAALSMGWFARRRQRVLIW